MPRHIAILGPQDGPAAHPAGLHPDGSNPARIMLPLLACAMCLCLPSPAQALQTSYWKGFRYGNVVKFETRMPAEAAEAAKKYQQSVGYFSRVEKRNGKSYGVYFTTFAWDGDNVHKGQLTWVTASGAGRDWRNFKVSDPDWPLFARNVADASTPFGSGKGWRQSAFLFVESPDNNPPPFSLNPDGTSGAPTPLQLAVWRLENTDLVYSKSPNEQILGPSIDERRKKVVQEAFLAIANAGRANPNYRRQNRNREAVNLPTGLKPMRLNEKLNKAAQIQADYCAQANTLTHDQPRNRARAKVQDRLKEVGYNGQAWEAGGAGGGLAEYPTDWMKSETHYRPWWSLDAPNEDDVGFGFARTASGTWYVFAVAGAGEK